MPQAILPELLKKLLLKSDFSEAELAQTCGVSEKAVYTWLMGSRVPKPSRLNKALSALNASQEERSLILSLILRTPVNSDSTLGTLLWQARKQTGLSQSDAAQLMGVDPSRLSRWENGHNLPAASTLTLLCGIYDTNSELTAKILCERNDQKKDSLGWQLTHSRTAKDLTLSQCAMALGVDSSMLARWEKGESLPPVSQAPLILDVLGLDIDSLAPLAGWYPKNMETRPLYAQRLIKARVHKGLLPSDVRGLVGVHRNVYHSWEAGTVKPRIAHQQKLAQLLSY